MAGNLKGMANIQYKRSRSYIQLNNSYLAISHIEKAINIDRDLENYYNVVLSYLQLIDILNRVGQIDKQHTYLLKSEKICIENNYLDLLKSIKLSEKELKYKLSKSSVNKQVIIDELINSLQNRKVNDKEKSYNYFVLWKLMKNYCETTDDNRYNNLYPKVKDDTKELLSKLYKKNPAYQLKSKINILIRS
jgi:tetratricopeptide (TPR) repeat protein